MIVQCSNCKRVRHGEIWECPNNADALAMARGEVSHGYCPVCRDRQIEEVARRRTFRAAEARR